jgi:antitoxin MazE
MRVSVQKWGNSLALRIPKAFAEDAAVSEGSVVDLAVSEGRLVAVPVRKKRITLKHLLRDVKRGNLHREVDDRSPAGREAW